MKVAIVSFPGSFDLGNTRRVLEDLLGLETEEFSHEIENQQKLAQFQAVVIPGGAAFADSVFPGRLARASKVAPSLRKYAEGEGRLLGIGNGFQILCELGILPGAVLKNRNCRFLNQRLSFMPVNTDSVFSSSLKAEQTFNIPVSCNYGRYYADRRVIQEIEEKGLTAFHYTTRFGDPDNENTRHGSLNGIAGVLNRKKNALGVIFHPERAADPELGQNDGLILLRSFFGLPTT